MNDNIFMRASRDKLRFRLPIGDLNVEQLWDLPLTAQFGHVSLDTVARNINHALQEAEEESFVDGARNPEKSRLSLQLDILKAIIAEKIAARDRIEKARKNNEHKQRLLAALENKEELALSEMSIEDIRKAIEEIDSYLP